MSFVEPGCCFRTQRDRRAGRGGAGGRLANLSRDRSNRRFQGNGAVAEMARGRAAAGLGDARGRAGLFQLVDRRRPHLYAWRRPLHRRRQRRIPAGLRSPVRQAALETQDRAGLGRRFARLDELPLHAHRRRRPGLRAHRPRRAGLCRCRHRQRALAKGSEGRLQRQEGRRLGLQRVGLDRRPAADLHARRRRSDDGRPG